MITTNKGYKFNLITQKPGPYNSLSWRAETPSGQIICKGVTDNPKTQEEKINFIEEVRYCVDYSIEVVK